MSLKNLPDVDDQTPPVFTPPPAVKQQSRVAGKPIRLSNILVKSKKPTPKRKSSVTAKVLSKVTKTIDSEDRFVYTLKEVKQDTRTLVVTEDPQGLLFDDDQVKYGSFPSASFADGLDKADVDDIVTVIINYQTRECIILEAGGGSTRVLLRLKGDSQTGNDNEFQGAIVDKRGVGYTEEKDVTVYAPQMAAGSLTYDDTEITNFWRADEVENVDGIADAFSGANPNPAKIYEIFPAVWY